MVEPDGVGSQGYGFAVEVCFERFIGRIEDEDLIATAAGPKAIKLAINAFKPGELQRELLQPVRGRNLLYFRLAEPASSFDIFDRNLSDFDNPSTGAKE